MNIANLILVVDSVRVFTKCDSLLQNATAILLQNEIGVYYKICQAFTTKCNSFITKCDIYYKLRQLYHYKMRQLLKNVMFITNCDSTYIIIR